jgi:hypothetical protein
VYGAEVVRQKEEILHVEEDDDEESGGEGGEAVDSELKRLVITE